MSLQGVAAVRMLPAARRNLWAAAWWRFARNRVRVLAAGTALLIVAASVAAPLVAPTRYDVAEIAESLQQPSPRHWLMAAGHRWKWPWPSWPWPCWSVFRWGWRQDLPEAGSTTP